MKIEILAVCGFLFVGATASPYATYKDAFESKSYAVERNAFASNDDCTIGPEYWCTNLVNAKSCGAVTYCIQHQWQQQTHSFDKGNLECQECVNVVKHIRNDVNSNVTLRVLKSLFKQTCKYIPDKKLGQECDQYVDKYIPELLELVSANLDGDYLCSIIGLCHKHKAVQESAQDRNQNELACGECVDFSTELLDELHKMDADPFLFNMMQVCRQQSSTHLIKKCNALILSYTDKVYAHLTTNLHAETVCLKSGVCAETDKIDDAETIQIVTGFIRPQQDNSECALCKETVNDLHNHTVATFKTDVKKILDAHCEQQNFKPNCASWMNRHYGHYFDVFDELNPVGICYEIEMCQGNADVGVERDESYKADQFAYTDAHDGKIDEVNKGIKCSICKKFIKTVEKKLKNDDSRQQIIDVLKHACNELPEKNMKKVCISAIEHNADYFINAFLKHAPPNEICHHFGFCKTVQGSKATNALKEIDEHLLQKYTEAPLCVACEFVMTKIDAIIGKKETRTEIEEDIRKVCSLLPSGISAKCKNFVDTYIDLAINFMTELKPQEFCGLINFCRTNQMEDTAQHDILQCGVCNMAVDAYSTVLSKNGRRDRPTLISVTCNLMPAKYHQQCVKFMNVYLESLTNMIHAGETKSQMCVSIAQCYADGDNSLFSKVQIATMDIPEKIETGISNEAATSLEVRPASKEIVGAMVELFVAVN